MTWHLREHFRDDNGHILGVLCASLDRDSQSAAFLPTTNCYGSEKEIKLSQNYISFSTSQGRMYHLLKIVCG